MELNERQLQILSIINEKQFVTVQALCGQIFASPATIRRDLCILEENESIIRTWGGAIPIIGSNQEIPHDIRLYRNSQLKTAIAKKALTLINNSSTIFLDSSTTCAFLAQRLGAFENLTVMTNGLDSQSILLHIPSVKTIVSGGVITKGYEMRGPLTQHSIECYRADLFFLSCCAISVDAGVTFTDEENAAIKQRMAKNAKKKILLCDSTKFDISNFCKSFDFTDFDHIVCDTAPKNKALRNAIGSRLLCADDSHLL